MSTLTRKSAACSDTVGPHAPRHAIPVIDRMMDVLGRLESRPGGASITMLTAELALPRTTIYRILNTLQAHDMVQRDAGGAYRLGRRLLSLASHVASDGTEVDLAAMAQPFLDSIAVDLGFSVKLSVLDREGILVLAVAQGRRPYALAVTPGQRMPIHAGAAGKLLFAHLPPEQQRQWLARPLQAFTPRTITEDRRLKAEAARIRRLGWAQDRGESAPGIHAFAAPVVDGKGRVVAALSIPYLLGTDRAQMDALRDTVMSVSRQISSALETQVLRNMAERGSAGP